MVFADRRDAGRRLATRLSGLIRPLAVLGLLRGGVPVAYEIARELGAPLDVVMVRKVGVPAQPELAMGAVGEGGVRIRNEAVLRSAGVPPELYAAVERRHQEELERSVAWVRARRPRVEIAGATAVVVDDGIATGATARAACLVARAHGARRVVLAVPVAPASSLAELAAVADEVVCLRAPERLFAVGQWYLDFSPTSERELSELLVLPAARGLGEPEEVEMALEGAIVAGRLRVPALARGVVLFAHGSGSNHLSPRNAAVARALEEAGLGTLLFDLFAQEEAPRTNAADAGFLGRRLIAATCWLRRRLGPGAPPFCYFGTSTGAAAALWAAAEASTQVAAVVSRGGRLDLAAEALPRVGAPTLLVVGQRDTEVLGANVEALARLGPRSRLEVVPGATHLFEEPGALDTVAALATRWFLDHLPERAAGATTPEGAS